MADSVKIKITGDASEFQSTLSGLGNSAKGVFKGMMASQIVTKGFSMLAGGIKSALDTGMQFEAAMSQVAAISGATGAELERLTETAKHYGETTMFSASQAAEALNYMALAGWDADQSIAALGGVLDLAAASGMDLGAASDAVTDYLSAFGMEASQAGYMADLMAYAQARSNTTATMLADAYGNCASSMHAAGQDIETTTAMLMALANQGIKGSEAGTQMAAVMRDLTQKMDKGKIMIGDTAVQVADAQGNFRDLNDIIADVGKAVEGMGTAEASAAIMTTFTARSVKAIQTILNEGIGSVNEYEAALRGSEGTAAEQAETMLDNLQGDIQIYKSALEGLQITASESFGGVAREAVQFGTDFLTALNEGGKRGGLDGMLDALMGELPKVTAKITELVGKGLDGLSGRLPGLVRGLLSQLPDILSGAVDLIGPIGDALGEGMGAVIEHLIANLPQYAGTLARGLGNLFVSALKGVGSLVGGVVEGVGGMLGLEKGDSLDRMLSDVFDVTETRGIKVPDVEVDGEIKTDGYMGKIEAAKLAIATAVYSLGMEDGEEAEKLKQAILRGSGAEALGIALKALNVPDSTADAVVNSIKSLKGKLEGVFEEFGIEDEDGTIAQGIADFVAQGGSLEEAFAKIAGLSAEDAKAAAEKLQPDIDLIVDTLNALGIDNIDMSDVITAAATANGEIEMALRMLGLDDKKIQEALDGVERLGESISQKIKGVFESLKQALTDGDPENDAEAVTEAMDTIDEAAKEGHDDIDTWLQGYIDQLDQMDLSADEYKTKVEEAQATAQQMHEELDATIQAAKDWVTENAGKGVDEIKSHIGELDGLLADIESLEERIEALNQSLTSGDWANRRAVEAGYFTTDNQRATALKTTYDEYAKAVLEAEKELAEVEKQAEADIEQAWAEYRNKDIDKETFDARIKEAGDRTAAAAQEASEKIQAASDNYAEHMRAIAQAALSTTPGVRDALDELIATADVRNLAKSLKEWTAFAAENKTGWTVDDMLGMMGVDDAQMGALADALGVSVDTLKDTVQAAIYQGMFQLDTLPGLSMLADGTEEMIASSLEGVDLTSAMAAFKYAYEQGWMQTTEDIDWSDPAAAMKQIMLDFVNETTQDIPAPEIPVEPKVEPDGAFKDAQADAMQEEFTGVIEKAAEGASEDAEVTLAPEVSVAPDTGSASAQESTVEPVVSVAPEVQMADDTAGKIEAAMEEVTGGAGEARPVEPQITVAPEIVDAEATRQALYDGMINATQGMSMDDVLQNAGIERADFDAMAGAMGLEPDAIWGALQAAINSGDPAAMMTGMFAGIDLSAMTKPIGDGVVQGIVSGTQAGEGQARAAGQSVGLAAVEGVADGADTHSPSAFTMQVGSDVDEGLIQGTQAGQGAVQAAGQAVGRAAVEGVRAGATNTSSIGRQISAGVASGILSGRSAVVSAAISVCRAAVAAMRSSLQIASPSKVTRQIGKYTGEGFGIGLQETLRSAVRSAQGVVSAANLAPQADFSGISGALSGAVNDIAGIEGRRNIVLNVNGRQLAQVMREDTARTNAAYSRTIGMGVGK
ncbi:MAG: phage tail tape measure protein [Clostridiales bacterium]|nr:phage tail tape measure protein [Clostridiales bacterium]